MIDKQAMKRQYLEADSRAGVYLIRNRVTGRALVAGSRNAQGRLNRHRFELRFGQHRNPVLAQDWIEHGESSFQFEILDLLEPSEDPTFNIAQELEARVDLWQQEIPCRGVHSYGESR